MPRRSSAPISPKTVGTAALCPALPDAGLPISERQCRNEAAMKFFQHIKYRISDYIYQKRGLMPYTGIPTPKILFIILLYSASFTLFLAGVKHIQVEQTLARAKNLQAARRAKANTDDQIDGQNDLISLQNHLAENIFRLHITADSDTVKDQNLKLKVRDEIISHLRETIKNAESPAQAEERITPQIPQLTEIAQNTLARYGCDAPVRVTIENRIFPEKTYGDLTFPAGTYRALCVDIGKAGGQNWWCVLFPSLCFIDETTATVPEESKERLKENLTEEEYEALEKPEVHSALLDWLN